MTAQTDFDRLASNAAAMNAEDAFDRCLAEVLDHGNDRAAARMSYVQRTISMNSTDAHLEFKALQQAFAYLAHQRDEDDVLQGRSLANALYNGVADEATRRQFPKYNNDPYSVKSPRGAFGAPTR